MRSTLFFIASILTAAVALPVVDVLPQLHQQGLSLSRRASPGCGSFHLLKGITLPRFIKSGTRSRSYFVHTPANYDTNKAYPVVVGFHGSSSIGLFFEADSKLSDSKYSGDVSATTQAFFSRY
jgi:hypothetical protein